MQMRKIALFALVVLPVALAGCSGGSGSGSGFGRCSSSSSSAFCVTSCNLGCSTTGCAITDIAQNQPILFNFSKSVSPSSVNAGTVSIKTASGEAPVGKLEVSGNSIFFQPEIRTQGASTFFGFRANETYILSLPGGANEPQSLRSASNDPLGSAVTCTLNVSQGIIDLDGQPPVATLASPALSLPTTLPPGVPPPPPPQPGEYCYSCTTLEQYYAQYGVTYECPHNVPSNVTIVLDFSEIIDVAPFQGATTATAPVHFLVSKTIKKNGVAVCNPDPSAWFDLGGVPQATVQAPTQANPSGSTQIILRPAVQLPSEAAIAVEVTDQVHDLSGKSAQPMIYTFITEPSATAEQEITEKFLDERQLDRDYSAGTWTGGEGRPGAIGGDGHLGDFDVTFGQQVGSSSVYQWNTDSMTIPGTNTLSGQPETITDGVFEFSNVHLPAGTTLKFVGSKIPRLLVRGSADIEGSIDVSAPDMVPYIVFSSVGQSGGAGGPGGATGGRGADPGDGTGNKPAFNGRDGQDVRLPAGHAYAANAVGTGGKGAPQYPASGLNSAVTFNLFGSLCGQIQGGGGGGGFITPGEVGTVVASQTGENGPDTPGGTSMSLLPLPAGVTSLEQFLVGGSGGGGGGSHPYFSSSTPTWRPGAGGSGGGGAVNLRIGSDLTMQSGSSIESHGGKGATPASPPTGPGGGGSGGSVLMQVGRSTQLLGSVDTAGGPGGFTNSLGTYGVNVQGGTGGDGYIRLETPVALAPSALGQTTPPATPNNVGKLTATDPRTGFQSKFYATRQLFPPAYLRYAIQAELDGTAVVFSDDPAYTDPFGPNVGRAIAGQAIEFFVQGAKVDPVSGMVDNSTIGPWRTWVVSQAGANNDLNDDNATGFRFLMLLDRTINASIVIKKMTVFFRG